MAELRLRDTAERDFLEIGVYTRERWSEAQTETYIQELLHVIEQIADYPMSGQDVGWIRPGYRRRRAAAHLVFYVVMPDGAVEIARILHEKSDVVRRLEET